MCIYELGSRLTEVQEPADLPSQRVVPALKKKPKTVIPAEIVVRSRHHLSLKVLSPNFQKP